VSLRLARPWLRRRLQSRQRAAEDLAWVAGLLIASCKSLMRLIDGFPLTVRSHLIRAGAALLMAASAIGCVRLPPKLLAADRFDYSQSVAESWKRQMLLNVVRLRYADAPVFMDVTSVISSYALFGSVSAGTDLFAASPNRVGLGATGSVASQPTFMYQPLTGEKFMKAMLRPIPPAGLFQMLQTGWPPDMLLRISVRSINGLRNASKGAASDPRFEQLIAVVSKLQAAGGLNFRIDDRKDGEADILALPPSAGTSASDRAEVQRLLGVDPGTSEYSVTFGLTPRSPTEIAVLTRSMIEIMVEYGVGIEVPDTDRKEGRVMMGAASAPGVALVGQLVHVMSGPSAPADAYASVPYRGRWFWVDDRDTTSKLRFTILMLLSSLAETGLAQPPPVVTVPSR
jgi:hypothetical protein